MFKTFHDWAFICVGIMYRRFHDNTSSIHSKMICSSHITDFTFNSHNLLAKVVLSLAEYKCTVRTEHLTKFKCKSMKLSISFFLFSDSVKIRLIRTIRRQSVWTLRWSALRCWVFLSAYSCKSHNPLLYIQWQRIGKCVCIWFEVAHRSLYVTDGTLQDKRGSSALPLRITEERRVRYLSLRIKTDK